MSGTANPSRSWPIEWRQAGHRLKGDLFHTAFRASFRDRLRCRRDMEDDMRGDVVAHQHIDIEMKNGTSIDYIIGIWM